MDILDIKRKIQSIYLDSKIEKRVIWLGKKVAYASLNLIKKIKNLALSIFKSNSSQFKSDPYSSLQPFREPPKNMNFVYSPINTPLEEVSKFKYSEIIKVDNFADRISLYNEKIKRKNISEDMEELFKTRFKTL